MNRKEDRFRVVRHSSGMRTWYTPHRLLYSQDAKPKLGIDRGKPNSISEDLTSEDDYKKLKCFPEGAYSQDERPTARSGETDCHWYDVTLRSDEIYRKIQAISIEFRPGQIMLRFLLEFKSLSMK
ncbi:hypothetical protein AYI69_g11540 [Smittium culicis]|uniref:Uncharacterized protein n=1 Tax=Smittium culicis TaxID=133412 RepID=A0A1R1WXT6_9FUNG|nr:hypothetical protein AYI69_g11540 [Smittium culicis]